MPRAYNASRLKRGKTPIKRPLEFVRAALSHYDIHLSREKKYFTNDDIIGHIKFTDDAIKVIMAIIDMQIRGVYNNLLTPDKNKNKSREEKLFDAFSTTNWE